MPVVVFLEDSMANVKTVLAACAFAASSLYAETFGGFGVTISPSAQGVSVVEVIPGSPAAAAGLRSGDQIVSVDHQALAGKSIDQSRSLLRGTVGTTAELGVIRGSISLTTRVQRATLEIKEMGSETIASWYGNGAVDGSALNYLAEKSAAQNSTLLGVMQNGRLVETEAAVVPEGIEGVYLVASPAPESEQHSSSPVRLQTVSASVLSSFDRTSIGFELLQGGHTVLSLLDSKGQLVTRLSTNAVAGRNDLAWDGRALPIGSYKLRIDQAGSSSAYSVQLR